MIIVQMGEALSYRWGTGQSPSPVDGHSLLPGRSLALVSLIITQMGTGAKQLLPSTAIALSYRWGMGQSPSPVDGHSLLPGRSLALVSLIITQLRDGAKLLPRRWPQLTTRAIPRPGSLHYCPNGGQVRSSCSRRRP